MRSSVSMLLACRCECGSISESWAWKDYVIRRQEDRRKSVSSLNPNPAAGPLASTQTLQPSLERVFAGRCFFWWRPRHSERFVAPGNTGYESRCPEKDFRQKKARRRLYSKASACSTSVFRYVKAPFYRSLCVADATLKSYLRQSAAPVRQRRVARYELKCGLTDNLHTVINWLSWDEQPPAFFTQMKADLGKAQIYESEALFSGWEISNRAYAWTVICQSNIGSPQLSYYDTSKQVLSHSVFKNWCNLFTLCQVEVQELFFSFIAIVYTFIILNKNYIFCR